MGLLLLALDWSCSNMRKPSARMLHIFEGACIGAAVCATYIAFFNVSPSRIFDLLPIFVVLLVIGVFAGNSARPQ